MKKNIVLTILLSLLISPLFAEGNKEVSSNGNLELTIIHTNDTHSHLDKDYKGRYGSAKIKYTADQIKLAHENVLFLDAGDFVMGTIFYTIFEGVAERDVMNLMNYDAMTLGNHEFDNGNEGMKNFLIGLNTPVVNANIDFSNYPEIESLVKPYIIKEYNGRKVGIIGATLPETPTISSPSSGIVFNEVVNSVQTIVDELEKMDIDIIILLSHNGLINDIKAAESLNGIDVIVGGHSHSTLLDENYPKVVTSVTDEPVLIVQAGEYNKYLGNLAVIFNGEGIAESWEGAPIPMTADVNSDPEIQAYIDSKNLELEPFTSKIIGEVKTELLRSRTEESNIGNLIADAMLEEVKQFGVQIALTNSGGIRADVGVGDLSMQKLMEVLPFGNLVATFDIKGSDLWQVFENGLSKIEEEGGCFLQMSGAKMVWDPSKPPFDYETQTGGRVVEIMVSDGKDGWNALDPDKIYKVAANNYIRGGGDDFQVLKEKAINPYDAGPLDLDVFTSFVEKIGSIDYEIEGRITTVK